MPVEITISNKADLRYAGNSVLDQAAIQAATIIAQLYEHNRVGLAGWHYLYRPSLTITITEHGFIDITNSEKRGDNYIMYPAGAALILGALQGSGLAQGKKVLVDRGERSSAPVGASIQFESFSDLAESVNILGKSIGIERGALIDIDLIPLAYRPQDKILLQRAQDITEAQLTEHEKAALKWLRSHQRDPSVVSQSSEPGKCRIDVKSLTPTQAQELSVALRDAGVQDITSYFNWQHPEQDNNPHIIANRQEVGQALKQGLPRVRRR